MALQLCGIGTVAWGNRKTRKLFGEKSYPARFREWRARRTASRALTGAAMMAEIGDMSSAEAYLSQTAGPDATVERRITVLEANLDDLRQRHDKTRRELQEESRTRKAAVDAERQTREHGDEDVRAVIREAAAGGLDLSAMGVLWLFAGVILGTASQEIVSLGFR
jgi:hypothetical protein